MLNFKLLNVRVIFVSNRHFYMLQHAKGVVDLQKRGPQNLEQSQCQLIEELPLVSEEECEELSCYLGLILGDQCGEESEQPVVRIKFRRDIILFEVGVKVRHFLLH